MTIKTNDSKNYTSKIAYYLWQDAGKPEGRDLEFWLWAEDIIKKFDEAYKPIPFFKTPYVLLGKLGINNLKNT